MNIKPWPVTVGVLVDAGASVAVAALYLVWMFIAEFALGTAPTDEPVGTAGTIVIEILGLLCTALGGFVAARKAKTLELRHGIAVGAAALLLWLPLEFVVPEDDLPWWYTVVSWVAVVPAGAFGGYLAARRADRSPRPLERSG